MWLLQNIVRQVKLFTGENFQWWKSDELLKKTSLYPKKFFSIIHFINENNGMRENIETQIKTIENLLDNNKRKTIDISIKDKAKQNNYLNKNKSNRTNDSTSNADVGKRKLNEIRFQYKNKMLDYGEENEIISLHTDQ